jgi:hypothetical protein
MIKYRKVWEFHRDCETAAVQGTREVDQDLPMSHREDTQAIGIWIRMQQRGTEIERVVLISRRM